MQVTVDDCETAEDCRVAPFARGACETDGRELCILFYIWTVAAPTSAV